MLARPHTLGGKALLAGVIASALLVAACGSGPTTGNGGHASGTPGALTACTATTADLKIGAGGTATAPKASGVSGKLAIDGSTALAPLFQAAGQEFDAANGTQTTTTPNGSGTGLKDVASGAVQIGLSDVFAASTEPAPGAYSGLVDHQVAGVAFTLITNPDLKGKVNNLTSDEVKQIWAGAVTNWSQLGGPNEQITVIQRPASSGTRATFKQYVLGGASDTQGTPLTQDTSGAVASAIAQTPGSIGYIATGYVIAQANGQVAPICLDGYAASLTNISGGKYAFWNIEHAYTKGPATGNAKALLQYVLSPAIQQNDLPRLGFLPLGSLASASASHTPNGAPAPETFS